MISADEMINSLGNYDFVLGQIPSAGGLECKQEIILDYMSPCCVRLHLLSVLRYYNTQGSEAGLA